ncbi:hypothetical protein HA402_014468 [Bradysia odoriphaga]|nr:hypothetical protein HA402_014468 [Bradysia odoriphaga]
MTSKVGKIGKVVICGMKGIGKTAILEQLIYGSITPDSELYSTIEDTYVASVDTGRGPRDILRIFDTAGLQGNVGLPRQYLQFADAFVLVYDPSDAASLDMLAGIKNDIDKNKEKKEVSIVVIANIRRLNRTPNQSPEKQSPEKKTPDPIELILNRANSWCARERIKHYTVNALERASLYEPFVSLAVRLHPAQTKSTFPQLSKLTQKASKVDN